MKERETGGERGRRKQGMWKETWEEKRWQVFKGNKADKVFLFHPTELNTGRTERDKGDLSGTCQPNCMPLN